MGDERAAVATSTRVWLIVGFVLAALFLAVGVAAFFAGGGPIVAAIGVVGGILCLAASIIALVRR